MSNAIKVGDRVWASGLGDGRMLAIHDDYGWVLWNTHDHCTARLDSLTRIEPEPVTLRPRFKLGEKICPRDGYPQTILAVSVSYRLAPNGTWWGEEEVDRVPTPCPTCKGSGKSKGSA